MKNKGKRGLMEDVDGSSLPAADSQRVGGHLALSLHSPESDLHLSVVCVLTLRYVHMYTCRCSVWQPADYHVNVTAF